jgi:hypothetical protein
MSTQDEGDKKRREPHAPRTGAARHEQEPSVGDDESPELENDQADSGPDRDHKQLGD